MYPTFYEKAKRVWYILWVIVFVMAVGLLRGCIIINLYNQFVLPKPRATDLLTLAGYLPGGILTFVLSLIFRIAIAYFTLKQQTEEILGQKNQAVLNLLKSQVLVTGQEQAMICRRLKDIEGQLPPPFARIHNLFIINTKQLTKILDNYIYIANRKIPISEKFKDGFMTIINKRKF